MGGTDTRDPSDHERTEDDAASSGSGQLADAAMALLGCRSADDVHEVICDFMVRIAPGAVVIVNEATPEMDWLITRKVAGLDDSLLAKAADIFGVTIVGSRWPMLPDYRDEVLGGDLVRMPGGITELVSQEIPRPLAEASARLLRISDVFTIGIADGESALGSIRILTRTPDVVLPAHTIESFARHCYSALANISSMHGLAESAERNRLMLRNMTEGLALHEIILDETGEPCDYRFLDVNRAFEDATGLKAEDIVGRTVLDVLPGTEPSWIRRYGTVATTRVATRFEDYSSELGRYFEVAAYSPQPGQFATVVSDITERRRAAAALRESEAQKEAILNGISTNIALVDKELRILWANRTAADSAGKRSDEMVGFPCYSFWGDSVGPCTDCPTLMALQTGRSEHKIVRTPDGRVWDEGGEPVLDEDGDVVAVVEIAQDITEREQAEAALRESERWLSESQYVAKLGHYVYDIEREIWVGSPSLHDVLGTDENDAGSFAGWLATVHPDDREWIPRYFTEDVLGKRAPFDIEYRIVRPLDGVERWVHGLGTVEFREDGQPVSFFGTIQDITERKRAEEEILRLNTDLEQRVQERTEELSSTNEELLGTNIQLEEATRAKSEFLAAMSHELRTPLNSIIGFSGVLSQELAGSLNEEQRRQVGMINNSGRHLLELVNEILDLAKIEAGQKRPEVREVDVGAVARETLDTVGPMADTKGIEMRLTCPESLTPVRTDALCVNQILLNILGNAVKFTEHGRIVTTVAQDGSGVTIAVEDSGCGIAAEDVERVFDDFFQVTPYDGGKSQGTGLGLAVSRRLAESIGAQIDVTSEPGRGSVFTLRIPEEAQQDR